MRWFRHSADQAPSSAAGQVDQEIDRRLGRYIEKRAFFYSYSDYLNRVRGLYNSFDPKLVEERLRKRFGFAAKKAPLFQLEDELIHSYYPVRGSRSVLREECLPDGRFVCGREISFDCALQEIRNADLPKKGKRRMARALRKHFPAETYQLSEICGGGNHPDIPGCDFWRLGKEDQIRIAGLLFGPDTDPLQAPSGDPAEDRREAFSRISTFLFSCIDSPVNLSFSRDNVSAGPGSFFYCYYYEEDDDDDHCYDGGCGGWYYREKKVCVNYHPPGEWDDLLLFRAAAKKSGYTYPREVLSRGNCLCFNDSFGHLYLKNPFGVLGTLEIYR